MNINENALKVLEKRYIAKDEEGNPIETLEEMFERVITVASDVEDPKEQHWWYKVFKEMITNLEFLPNSPTIMNAKRPLGQLSACFVLPVEDSMEGIFDAIKNAAIIHKTGGGTGFSFSRLRAKNSTVKTTGGVASGPVSFMKVFNAATEAVKQGGTRRGANMGMLRVDHPDILEFIKCKNDNNEINNFNISVAVTTDFMLAVEMNAKYALKDPRTGNKVGELDANEVFDMIVDSAWKNGEPGIIFIDEINKDNPTPELGEIEATNPCGEQPLLPYEACNLGSINLALMVKDGKVDWDRLKAITRSAVRYLDNIIDANKYPLPQIDEMVKKTRKIGLGVMGWADMLIKLGIPYNSEEAIELAEEVMRVIDKEAEEYSWKLGAERGGYAKYKLEGSERNAARTTIAPTGTISMIAGCSSGIEPIFGIVIIRNQADMEMIDVNPEFERIAHERGFYSYELMKEIAEKGSIQNISSIPEDVKRIFVTAHDVSPQYHVLMQSAFQRYTNNAVSKTINLCNSATKEDVRNAYLQAYKLGCKGITIYRDGSRDSQVLSTGASYKKEEPKTESVEPRKRPEITTGKTPKYNTGCGKLYVTVNHDENGICEVFTNTGRIGGCPAQSEATSRLVSLALRSGVDGGEIVEQLKGIRCMSCIRRPGVQVKSCPDAIGRALEEELNIDIQVEEEYGPNLNVELPKQSKIISKCEECGEPLEHEGGCSVCRNCGNSKCG